MSDTGASTVIRVCNGVCQGSPLSLDATTLQAYGITHIVNCAAGKVHSRVYSHRDISILDLDWEDSLNLFDCMPGTPLLNVNDAVRFMQKAVASEGGCVLVHCTGGGASLSSAVVLLYLIRTQGLHADDALAQLQTKRPVSRPNASFMGQLRRYCVTEEITPLAKRASVISSRPMTLDPSRLIYATLAQTGAVTECHVEFAGGRIAGFYCIPCGESVGMAPLPLPSTCSVGDCSECAREFKWDAHTQTLVVGAPHARCDYCNEPMRAFRRRDGTLSGYACSAPCSD
jgi:predicted protein tyrosine phosphatase